MMQTQREEAEGFHGGRPNFAQSSKGMCIGMVGRAFLVEGQARAKAWQWEGRWCGVLGALQCKEGGGK